MTFITSERYKEELKRNLSFCHKFRSVPRSFQKELVPDTVPQKGTSSRNVRYLNEVLERTGYVHIIILLISSILFWTFYNILAYLAFSMFFLTFLWPSQKDKIKQKVENIKVPLLFYFMTM